MAIHNRPASWNAVLARYDAALAAEAAYEAKYIDPFLPADLPAGPERTAAVDSIPREVWEQVECLAALRYTPEDELLDMPSPDLAAFARKVIICRADQRDLNGLDDMLVAEARRLTAEADAGNSAWNEALAAVEKAAEPMRETSKAFHAIDATWCADRSQSPETSTAWDLAWEGYSVAMDRYHAELRNLIFMVPAPNTEAALIKAQLLLDAQLNDDKLSEQVATELRLFSRYANQER